MKREHVRSARREMVSGACVVAGLFVTYFLLPFDRVLVLGVLFALVTLGSTGPLVWRGCAAR